MNFATTHLILREIKVEYLVQIMSKLNFKGGVNVPLKEKLKVRCT